MTAASCEMTEGRLLAYAAGDLAEDGAATVAEHLVRCAPCREAAVELVSLEGALADGCSGELMRWHRFPTPFGRMYVAASGDGLVRVTWDPRDDDFVAHVEDRFPDRPVVRDGRTLAEAERQLRAYFSGELTEFELPVDLGALGDFDRRVLRAAREIGFGQVLAYGEVARRIGRPRAARAVGGALGRNPVAIVVPCHRVVRSDGSLGGYGGGVHWKERLLSLEGAQLEHAG